jgi:outer membrane biosynthesis protein TonB
MEMLFEARSERRDWKGPTLSLVLHAMLLLMALWYVSHRPRMQPSAFRALPVELVLGGSMGQNDSHPAARLEVAKPHPESAPAPEGVSPKGTRQPEDELSAKLRALAQLQTPDAAMPTADNTAAPGAGSGSGGGEGNYALKDFIRAQILRRWLPDLSIEGARNMPVQVRVRLLSSGVIDDVTILDQERFHTDKIFRNMALSARDAALLASPIQLPPGRYQRVTVLTIDLDPKAVLR